MTETWYRVADKRYADYDPWAEYDQPNTSTLKVEIIEFEVVKYTPKGVWLDNGRWVSNHTNKQYACPTKELAFKSFLARKEKQKKIHLAKAQDANKAIFLAIKMLESSNLSEETLIYVNK